MTDPRRARLLRAVLLAALCSALAGPALGAGADWRPARRDRSLAAGDTLGRRLSEAQRRRRGTRAVRAQRPARAPTGAPDVSEWLSRWGAVEPRAER